MGGAGEIVMGVFLRKTGIINPGRGAVSGGGAFDGKYASVPQIYAPCNSGPPNGGSQTTGTIFFYANAFIMPKPGIITSLKWQGIGNAGNSGATEDLEWAVFEIAGGLVSNIIAQGIHSQVNTDNGARGPELLNISVPAQFLVGIIGVPAGQWNIETCDRRSHPGIPSSTASVNYGYPSVTRVTYDPPAVGSVIAWGQTALVQNVGWKES
jgi:hypothetical protein